MNNSNINPYTQNNAIGNQQASIPVVQAEYVPVVAYNVQPTLIYPVQGIQQPEAVRCIIPGPFDGGYADILADPQNYLVYQKKPEKKGFFDQVLKEATTIAQKATVITKNFVDNKKIVLCNYCIACQTIDNNQLNFYCSNCKYLNNQLWTPPRKDVYCGQCQSILKVDLGTTPYERCSKCSRWNYLPQLRPRFAVPPNHPNLNSSQFNEQTQKAQQNYQIQLQQQQEKFNQKK